MTAFGVVPPHEPGKPEFTETGSFVTKAGNVLTFGSHGSFIVLLTGSGDVVLSPAEQDLFARHFFRAILATEVIDAAEVPF